jgi:hypothetical protein
MEDKTMERYKVGNITVQWSADNRHGDLSRRESAKGYRALGGDHGDLWFDGFHSDDMATVIYGAVLVTTLQGLTKDDATFEAENILAEAYDSIGAECIY